MPAGAKDGLPSLGCLFVFDWGGYLRALEGNKRDRPPSLNPCPRNPERQIEGPLLQRLDANKSRASTSFQGSGFGRRALML